MNIQKLTRLTTLAIIAVSSAPPGLSAQEDQQDCPARVQRAETSTGPDKYGIALGALRRCPVTGPSVVASLWRSPPTDADQLDRLKWISGQFHDRRIFASLANVFADDGSTEGVRVAALEAMVMQTARCLSVGQLSPFTINKESKDSVLFLSIPLPLPHDDSRRGSQFVESGRLQRTLAVLDRVERSSSDQVMRARSRALARGLRMSAARGPLGCE